MSDAKSTPASPEIEPGVMSSLPKTRPQRPSARRNAARRGAAAKVPAEASAQTDGAKKAKSGGAKKSVKARSAKPRKAAAPPKAPPQGLEVESDVQPGKAVQPPGGAELAASVVDVLGELAQSGLNSGARLLRDALRLPRS